MPARNGTAHVVTTTRKYKDQVYRTHSHCDRGHRYCTVTCANVHATESVVLRRSYRDGRQSRAG